MLRSRARAEVSSGGCVRAVELGFLLGRDVECDPDEAVRHRAQVAQHRAFGGKPDHASIRSDEPELDIAGRPVLYRFTVGQANSHAILGMYPVEEILHWSGADAEDLHRII